MMEQSELLELVKKGLVMNGKRFNNPDFIETNSSLIVLVEDKAFKIIKEEKGEDYSDSRSRYSWLREEMRINSEITPGLYLGIRPIFIRYGQITVGDDNDNLNNAVEYALCMKRLRRASLVYNRLTNGTYSSRHSIIIARNIADFHISRLSGKFSHNDQALMQEFCSFDSLSRIVRQDFRTFEANEASFVPVIITELKYQRIKRYILRFLENNKDLLIKRVSTGYVVPIHGDFHSTNIFVEGDSVYIIDRVLRRNLRVNDTIKDPAYLSVDLGVFGLEREMECFLSIYQERVKDPYFERLLPFYMCRLAFVSGLVRFSSDNQSQIKAYFDLAYKYVKS